MWNSPLHFYKVHVADVVKFAFGHHIRRGPTFAVRGCPCNVIKGMVNQNLKLLRHKKMRLVQKCSRVKHCIVHSGQLCQPSFFRYHNFHYFDGSSFSIQWRQKISILYSREERRFLYFNHLSKEFLEQMIPLLKALI